MRVGWQSHAGKVCERFWYEKNKSLFPVSRWEVTVPGYILTTKQLAPKSHWVWFRSMTRKSNSERIQCPVSKGMWLGGLETMQSSWEVH